uniref:Large polyvalent protein-associated domain-containing protein n=1 Tax=Ditylenchus dipsaci TaxID=166011 RepID=A0A915ELG9_9BILA
MVKVIRGDDGLEKGEYVDPNTGMKFTIQLHGDPYVTQTSTKVKSTSQVQSIELEPHAQFVGIDQVKDLRNNRVMSLNDAQRLGLAKVDKKGKQTTKSYSAFRSNIELAVNKGVINSHGEKVSLEEAIRTHIIDIANLKYLHPRSGEPLDFSQAANQGLLDVTLAETLPNGVTHPATGEKISVKRAIDAGIINPRSGEVTHPFTNQRLSWVDLTKQIYNSITQNGIYDPKKGYAVPVTSALIDGLIDTHSQTYYNPITEERLTLEEAHHKGIIDGATYQAITKPFLHDYRTRRQLNLIQAVEAKLIDPRSRTVQLSADKVVPIAKAVEEGAIPREIGQQLRRVDKLTFAEAVGKGLIDVAQDSFTDPDSGKQMSIAEAAQQGLIDTGNVDLLEQSSGANLTKVLDSDQFDEKSGRVQNKDTRLHLPFGEAVHQRVIDPDSLLHDIDSSKTMTLREALNMGLIDNNGQYVEKKSGHRLTLNEAVKQGHLALIGSPMQAAQAVTEAVKRRDAEGYKFRIEPLQESAATRVSSSGPKFREETIVRRLTPQRAEPGLSVRVRSSVSDDPRRSAMSGGRASSLVDVDPLALVDRQHEFFESLRNKGVDLEDRVIENPSTMRNVSVREAVETGLLDMRLVNSGAGKKLMDVFNIASDELSTQLSPSHHFGSVGELHSTHTTSVSQPEPSNRQSWNRNISWENEKVTETETPWQGAPGEPPHNIAATYIPGHIPRENINRTTTQTLPDGSTHKSHYIVEHETSYD